jgi:Holliday junction resolvasome RuvABC endonuclease subunit
MSVFLGCDPGVGGALAVLTVNPDGSQTVTVTPTPIVWTRVGRSKRRRYDVPALFNTLCALPPVTLAYLEQQGARPGQGRTSMLTLGYGEGVWTALLVARHIPCAVVAPLRWRHQVGLRGGDKGAVRLMACRRFPGIPLKLDHADAVMLAVAAALGHGVVYREGAA